MKATGNRWTAAAVVAWVAVYVSTYLLSTEIFHGRLDATRYRIRLFQSEAHRRAFLPLSSLEGLLSPCDREFSAEIVNHASLPPPE